MEWYIADCWFAEDPRCIRGDDDSEGTLAPSWAGSRAAAVGFVPPLRSCFVVSIRTLQTAPELWRAFFLYFSGREETSHSHGEEIHARESGFMVQPDTLATSGQSCCQTTRQPRSSLPPSAATPGQLLSDLYPCPYAVVAGPRPSPAPVGGWRWPFSVLDIGERCRRSSRCARRVCGPSDLSADFSPPRCQPCTGSWYKLEHVAPASPVLSRVRPAPRSTSRELAGAERWWPARLLSHRRTAGPLPLARGAQLAHPRVIGGCKSGVSGAGGNRPDHPFRRGQRELQSLQCRPARTGMVARDRAGAASLEPGRRCG